MKPFEPDDSESSASRSDAELVHAARRGEKRAFVEIVARHQAMVCGITLGILGDFAASEDAGQEAFFTAWRKFHDLREPERLKAWLAQIARNAALGQLRRKRGHDPLDHSEEDLSLVDEAPTPDEAAASEEEMALVRESLSKLPEAQRLPLILYYREGKSVKAVADALGISEDAVKQRLARGREMLRDRISGTIETVLTRTRPNAIFTMTIAASIGALAAPAAVAGAAFTAASASVAGAATVSSTPSLITTVMSTSKTFLITAALVGAMCIPIGYQIHHSAPAPALHNAEELQPDPALSPTHAAPSYENSFLFAEWRYLHEQHGTNAEAMPLLHKAIGEMKDVFRRNAFRAALVSEWVQVDPAGGLKFLMGKGSDATERRQFFEEWLARDPRAAVDALIHAGKGWEPIARESLSAIARQVPAAVPDVTSRLPKSNNYWDTSIRDAFAVLAEGGFVSARKAAEAITGPNREQALAGVARLWGKSDLDGAIAWAKALPEGTDRDEVIRSALVGRAAVDPTGALQLAGTVPAGGREMYFATTTGARVLAEAAKTDFNATVAWVAANPGRFGHEDLVGLARTVTEQMNADPGAFLSARVADGSLGAILPAISSALLNEAGGQRAAVWDWIKAHPGSETTESLKEQVLSSGAWQEPALALKFATELPATPEGDKQRERLAQSLFNGGSMLHRFDQLLAHSPDTLRSTLIETAFGLLRADTIDDPISWVSRLSLLPEASRPKALSSIAGAWAERTPEEAVAWANSIPPGEGQQGAMAAIASAWAKKDAQGAAGWVSSLPAGAQRDRTAESLVMVVADDFPREAWDWALSIGDTSQRNRAAQQAAKALAGRDPGMARQLIEAAPLDGQTKMDLLAALEKKAK